MKVEDNGKKLIIRDLCKTCSSGGSDLMVIQCNASNKHGYAFADGYLNVLCKYKGCQQYPAIYFILAK